MNKIQLSKIFNYSRLLNTNKLFYHEKVIDHYEKPRNVGSFNKKDKEVGTGLVGAPACGDVMKLQIKVNEYGVIENAVFKVIIISYFLYHKNYKDQIYISTNDKKFSYFLKGFYFEILLK